MVLLTFASGQFWSEQNARPWKTDRVSSERVLFGVTVDELIAKRKASMTPLANSERLPLPDGYSIYDLLSNGGNRGSYSGERFISGYINNKSQETAAKLTQALLDENRGPILAKFLGRNPSFLAFPAGTNFNDALESLETKNQNVPTVELRVLDYKAGLVKASVVSGQSFTAVFNEAFFIGWEGRACNQEKLCRKVNIESDSNGLVSLQLDKGTYNLELSYKTPGRNFAWFLFWLGVFAMGLYAWLRASLLRNLNSGRSMEETQSP
jgi:hypothetical protein